jgi:hypothetical protein
MLGVFSEILPLSRMRLPRVDDKELHVLVMVHPIELFNARHLPAIGLSRNGAELDNDVLFPQKPGKIDLYPFGGLELDRGRRISRMDLFLEGLVTHLPETAKLALE